MIRKVKMLIVIIAANILTLGLWIVTMFGIEPSVGLKGVTIVLLVLVTFSTIAYFMNYWRFMLWGFLFASGMLLAEIAGMGISRYYFLVLGAIISFIGLIYLISFLNRYPAPGGD